ncbi:aspartate dehydrogenase [Tamaricihabitans halophyticus]|uniref:L-aspartate dehydrogenase n=1 Tax=Tamaricihabitans halophyticus TaxID=1262583 RepID=A0A4R2QB82_9PSEU|nr:aspartate dehydrogenase domain-containing protein [Tamaricihabitans halophyticus]TCP45799.1 aspartate dehydrogenase [Tamaricihabitans halophyticus]
MKVAVLGCGAIGAVVAHALADGEVSGAELVGVVHADATDPPGLPVLDFGSAVDRADLVVECAGQAALAEFGSRVLAAGKDLLVVSAGALADDAIFGRLTGYDAGRVYLSTGAIGGLDLLAAAARAGGLSSVRLTTTKLAGNLVQPWMDQEQIKLLRKTTEPIELLRGPARKVTAAFPKSANVAASVALAVGDWDLVDAAVVADPDAELTSHVLTAEGTAGSYRFEIRNHPSARTPTTSGIVPHAVLRAIRSMTGRAVLPL